ncbi:MAG: class I SAM-dependent methyltransferase [Lentisphaeria bacterium]|nr:class I SAM-dependent methyltransferase [Lentisphaeria bacterium]
MTNYWDDISAEYHRVTQVSCDHFHYGPLLPGDDDLGLLPRPLAGLRCLELGCGGGQNSIYLAARGAVCAAADYSTEQIDHARSLAGKHAVDISFQTWDMDVLNPDWRDQFDLVHSAYALPFLKDQGRALRFAADYLRPGGQLLFSTAHPLFAHEWADFEDGELALLLENYFSPPVDSRRSEKGHQTTCSPVTISSLVESLHQAGLAVRRLLEPPPLPVDSLTADEIAAQVPYYSEAWHHLYPQLSRVPAVLIILAQKLEKK